MVFDMQPDFARTGRLVARGHLIDSPSFTSYARVASRKTVQIEFALAVLIGLGVPSAEICNAYLKARTRKCISSHVAKCLLTNASAVWQ
jgi:hypothetical protein